MAGCCGFRAFVERLGVDYLRLRLGVCWGYELVGRHFVASGHSDWLGGSFWFCWWVFGGEVSGSLWLRGWLLWRCLRQCLFRRWSLDWDCSYIGLWCLSWGLVQNYRFSRSFLRCRGLSWGNFDRSWLGRWLISRCFLWNLLWCLIGYDFRCYYSFGGCLGSGRFLHWCLFHWGRSRCLLNRWFWDRSLYRICRSGGIFSHFLLFSGRCLGSFRNWLNGFRCGRCRLFDWLLSGLFLDSGRFLGRLLSSSRFSSRFRLSGRFDNRLGSGFGGRLSNRLSSGFSSGFWSRLGSRLSRSFNNRLGSEFGGSLGRNFNNWLRGRLSSRLSSGFRSRLGGSFNGGFRSRLSRSFNNRLGGRLGGSFNGRFGNRLSSWFRSRLGRSFLGRSFNDRLRGRLSNGFSSGFGRRLGWSAFFDGCLFRGFLDRFGLYSFHLLLRSSFRFGSRCFLNWRTFRFCFLDRFFGGLFFFCCRWSRFRLCCWCFCWFGCDLWFCLRLCFRWLFACFS